MKKSLFALAALNVVCATAYAQSSVTLYGIMDAGFGYTSQRRVEVSPGAAGKPAVNSGHSLLEMQGGAMSGDRWGLKGVEQLSPDLSAIFQVESGFIIGTGQLGFGGLMFGRQAYMGLDSKTYGSVTLGRQYDPIATFVAAIGPGAFTTGVTAHPGDLDNIDGQSRTDNAIMYKSPSLNGLQFGAMYGLGGKPGSANNQSMWSIGGQYANGPLALAAGFTQANNESGNNRGAWSSAYNGVMVSPVTEGFASSKTQRIAALASSYKIDKVTLGASYGFTQYVPGTFSTFSSTQTFNAFTLNAGYQATPALRLGVGYGYARGSSIQGADAPRYHTFGAAAFYNLSVRTTLYAIAGYQKSSGKTLDRFGNVVDATAVIGDMTTFRPSATQSQTGVRVGMRHTF